MNLKLTFKLFRKIIAISCLMVASSAYSTDELHYYCYYNLPPSTEPAYYTCSGSEIVSDPNNASYKLESGGYVVESAPNDKTINLGSIDLYLHCQPAQTTTQAAPHNYCPPGGNKAFVLTDADCDVIHNQGSSDGTNSITHYSCYNKPGYTKGTLTITSYNCYNYGCSDAP